MATRGRPPSSKTLVDRQLGRNVQNPILPTSDGFVIPNHSGISDHPEFKANTFWKRSGTFIQTKTLGDGVSISGNYHTDKAYFFEFDPLGTNIASDGDDVQITSVGSGLRRLKLRGLTTIGADDEVQVSIKGHSTQTNDIFVVEQSGGTDLLTVDNNGNLTTLGTVAIGGITSTAPLTIGGENEDLMHMGSTSVGLGLGGSQTLILWAGTNGKIAFADGGRTGINVMVFHMGKRMVKLGDGSTPITQVDSSGGIAARLVVKTADYVITDSDHTIESDATSSGNTHDLPAAATVPGIIYNIVKTDSSSNTVTIDPDGSETINGGTTVVLSSEGESITIQSNGTNWTIL